MEYTDNAKGTPDKRLGFSRKMLILIAAVIGFSVSGFIIGIFAAFF